MNMSLSYIISQALVTIAYIILGIGLSRKSRIQILIGSSVYSILAGIHYILLFGTMGAISCFIGVIRNLLFYHNEKHAKENSKLILYAFCIITIILTVVFYQSLFDIFPCILSIIGVYSYWNTSTKVTRIGNLLISACYIVYAISIQSYFTIILEVYLVFQTLIGYYKHEKN